MKIRLLVAITAMFAISLTLGAQMPMGLRTSDLSGVFNPVVGSGGAYETTDSDGKKSNMEITLLGQEEVEGKPGFWMEIGMTAPGGSGMMYIKSLMTTGADGMKSLKMIMQQPGQEPIEMDMNMMNFAGRGRGRGQGQTTPSDIRQKADRIGTETITVPGGTFSCDHYKMKDGSGDTWISGTVSPLGLVKTQTKDSTMVLTRVITNAQDHITGTPRKFDPSQMMRGLGQRGQ